MTLIIRARPKPITSCQAKKAMPIYVYKAKSRSQACAYCRQGFEILQNMRDKPLSCCPRCGNPLEKLFAPFSGGYSKTGMDRRAKERGFHKLKRVDKDKYQKLY